MIIMIVIITLYPYMSVGTYSSTHLHLDTWRNIHLCCMPPKAPWPRPPLPLPHIFVCILSLNVYHCRHRHQQCIFCGDIPLYLFILNILCRYYYWRPQTCQKSPGSYICRPPWIFHTISHHHHHHHQKAFRNKSHTSHGHRPGLKRNKSKGKRLTNN